MSFFNRMLASIGIGGATVDTRLESNRFRAGGEVKGIIQIRGGNVEQRIESIYLHLMTQYVREQDDRKVTETAVIHKFRVSEPMEIQPKQSVEVPFSLVLPLYTPVTVGKIPVWLRTGLEIDMAVDPGDNDYIQVLPNPLVETVLEAVNDLGFHMKNTQCEYSPRLGRGVPFVQEFEFYPTGEFRGRMKELELVFFHTSEGLEILMEVDRRARGFMGFLEEALELDERKHVLRLSKQQLQSGTHYVGNEIASMIQYLTR